MLKRFPVLSGIYIRRCLFLVILLRIFRDTNEKFNIIVRFRFIGFGGDTRFFHSINRFIDGVYKDTHVFKDFNNVIFMGLDRFVGDGVDIFLRLLHVPALILDQI